MSTVDYGYLGKSMASLSGIPVRVYQRDEELCRFFPVDLPKDPMELYRDEILGITEHVGYFASPLFHYYGVLNAGDVKLVVGPTSQIMADEQKLRELAFRLDVPREEVPAFIEGMNGILRMPVETLLQMLCTMNHFLNRGEKLKISDLAIHDGTQALLKSGLEQGRTRRLYEEENQQRQAHNTLSVENVLMDIVRRETPRRSRAGLHKPPPSRAAPSPKISFDSSRTPSSSPPPSPPGRPSEAACGRTMPSPSPTPISSGQSC